MKCILVAVFLFGIFLPSTYSRHVQFFRKDYTYIEEYDAFYKMHWDENGLAWNMAFLTCDDEGAFLFYPKAKGEWTLVRNLTDGLSEAPNVTEIFVGLHDEFDLGEFITVDGHSTPYPLPPDSHLMPHPDSCITMNIDSGSFKVDTCLRVPDAPLPFVCKKVDDQSCPTVDTGYKYLKSSNRCYKINKKPRMWQEAMKTCFMEGGVLAVIENEAQAEVKRHMTDSVTYFVGVRRLFSRSDYYTVKGQKFSEMYQNRYDDESHDCGVVYNYQNNLYTRTSDCGDRLPFICEMDVVV